MRDGNVKRKEEVVAVKSKHILVFFDLCEWYRSREFAFKRHIDLVPFRVFFIACGCGRDESSVSRQEIRMDSTNRKKEGEIADRRNRPS